VIFVDFAILQPVRFSILACGVEILVHFIIRVWRNSDDIAVRIEDMERMPLMHVHDAR